MISVDTSVVVRYLVGTPAAEARRAAALMDGPQEVAVSLVAVVETAHVLRTQYAITRADVIDTLIELLTKANIAVLGMAKADTLTALLAARKLADGPIPDALITVAAKQAGALPLYTFDKGMGRHGVPVASP